MIYLGADHKGYELKEKIAYWLFHNGYKFRDLGAQNLNQNDDYTTFASQVASLVAAEKGARGILFCGSGVGVDIVANKFDGVRAGIGKNAKQVKQGREDDKMNVLVLAAEFTNTPDAVEMVRVFLETTYLKNVRHERRLEDIKKIEANN